MGKVEEPVILNVLQYYLGGRYLSYTVASVEAAVTNYTHSSTKHKYDFEVPILYHWFAFPAALYICFREVEQKYCTFYSTTFISQLLVSWFRFKF